MAVYVREQMQYDIDGVLVASDGEMEINAEVRLNDAKVSIRARGSNRVRTIHAQKPAAIAFVDTLAAELLGGASLTGMRRPPVEFVMCPDCLGGEPEIWDCETCRGGGKVPG
jgi:hypothetical protein